MYGKNTNPKKPTIVRRKKKRKLLPKSASRLFTIRLDLIAFFLSSKIVIYLKHFKRV